jgi:glucose/arabinose dehydrogenase
MQMRPSGRRSVIRNLSLAAGCALALTATSTLAGAQTVRTGNDAYGDWQKDAPGVMREITPADLPAPAPATSTADRSKVIPKPAGAELKTMPGFTATAYVTGMTGARVLRLAPNGDIFLALSRPEGKIMVIRAAADMSNPRVVTFATGLRDPYGIAFYPPGPDPKWVYVGEYGKVVRFPYRRGQLTADGTPETVVSDLATGGNHWTRDVAFSPDGKTMYVAVGSASNVAADMGPRPANFAAFEKAIRLARPGTGKTGAPTC